MRPPIRLSDPQLGCSQIASRGRLPSVESQRRTRPSAGQVAPVARQSTSVLVAKSESSRCGRASESIGRPDERGVGGHLHRRCCARWRPVGFPASARWLCRRRALARSRDSLLLWRSPGLPPFTSTAASGSTGDTLAATDRPRSKGCVHRLTTPRTITIVDSESPLSRSSRTNSARSSGETESIRRLAKRGSRYVPSAFR